MSSTVDSTQRQPEGRPFIRPSKLGQFIALDGCPQYFEYEFNPETATTRRKEKNWKEAFEPLSLLLAKDGSEFETAVINTLEMTAHAVHQQDDITDWNDSKQALGDAFESASALEPGTGPIILTEVRFGIQIEAWPVAGDADIVAIWPTTTGIKIRVFEIKAAHEEKTYHELQVAVYALLCKQFLTDLDPDFHWEIEGGVIHNGTPLDNTTPEALPSFPLESPEMDVRRLLQPNGQLDELWHQDPASIHYQLAPKCHNCTYKESCYTDAIENEKPALLGLTRGEQQTLQEHNITSLHDLAELAYPPSEPRPYTYTDLTPANRSKYNALVSETDVGRHLPRYIQQAQALLNELDPESTYTPNSTGSAPWLVGSGSGELPEDNPGFDDETLLIERGSLIRSYLHVEWDHRNDRLVMLSAYITATNYAEKTENTQQEIAVVTQDYPTSNQEASQFEAELLTDFFNQVFATIKTVGAGMGRDTHAPIHFYCYGPDERTKLIEALRRHDADQVTGAARELLDLRGAIDQSMISVVQNDIRSRIALPVNNTGLLPVMDYFRPNEDFFPQTDWTYERPDGTIVNLRNAFWFKFFDFAVPFSRDGSGIHLYPNDEPDGFYPSRARQGSHIPLEYVWGALGRLNEEWVDSVTEEYNPARTVDPFKWVDQNDQSTRISLDDLRALGTRLARCLAHVERGIYYRNTNIDKHPIDLSNLPTFSLGTNTLSRACQEYLKLEHRSQRQDLLSLYRLPVRQRIQRGDSIPFVVTQTEETDGVLHVTGQLLYDRMFEDGDRIAGACRQKGPSGATGGSWMVANELDRQGDPVGSSNPYAIERGPGVMIENLDMDNRSIQISSIPIYVPMDQEFRRRHRQWTIDPSEATDDVQCFEENRIFVLDPRSDDLTAQRAFDVLSAEGDSFTTSSLEQMAMGELTEPHTDVFSQSAIDSFLDSLTDTDGLVPNESQRAFIRDCTAQFSLLHGPPGTGKTSGALATAILARLYSFAIEHKELAGVVSAESNKAVDELLDDVVTRLKEYESDPDTPEILDEVRLVRLTSDQPPDPDPRVEYLDYYADRAPLRSLVRQLTENRTTSQQTLATNRDSTREEPKPHVIVFGTPARIYGLVNQFDCLLDDTKATEDWVREGTSFFDLFVVDEASMMRLPSFLLAGAFVGDHGQVLIGGDHRQLPPVQQHNWENETRRIITERVPFLSTLDFFRALRGEDLDQVSGECMIAGTATIPYYRLEQTYRCHTTVTDVLHRLVYQDDGIVFRSDQTATIPALANAPEGVNAIMEPDAPLTLVIHREQASQQSNRLEAAVSAALTTAVEDSNTTTGIVTPHNAQRGLVSTIVPSTIEVDTVERYQGGERDCMIVSATASDPDFLRAEQEFILNPNRLNVAMSRMRQKLVVIASESVFELVPPEVEQYNRARVWKGLISELGVLDREPDWAGPLGKLTENQTDFGTDPETPITVYSIQPATE